jgi:hypothetical protein
LDANAILKTTHVPIVGGVSKIIKVILF